jgi:hypothetical protein
MSGLDDMERKVEAETQAVAATASVQPKKPKRLWIWITAAVISVALLLLFASRNAPAQVFGKLFGAIAGGIIGKFFFDTAMKHFAPTGFLAEPWHLHLSFEEGQSNQKIAPGCERLYIAACAVEAFLIVGFAVVMGLGN